MTDRFREYAVYVIVTSAYIETATSRKTAGKSILAKRATQTDVEK